MITFSFWFLQVIVPLPVDIAFGTIMIGGFGPMISGYIITVVNSGETIKIKSKSIFIAVFVAASAILILRLYFINNGLKNANGKIPHLNDVGLLSYILIACAFFVFALAISNATNTRLKENYFRSFFYEKGKVKWYIIGFLILIVLNLSSYLIGSIVGLKTSDFIIKLEPVWLIGLLSTFFFFGSNEEFGWRGFLQKEMQKMFNPLVSAFVVSLLWSFWHLPLYYNGFYTTGGYLDLLPRFVWTFPLTIVFTWLYNKSGYSILAVLILHAVNNSDSAFGSSYWPYTVLGILLSIYCIIDDKMWKKKPYHLVYEK
jgi:membrane protease YdiL (CAAX protease family)